MPCGNTGIRGTRFTFLHQVDYLSSSDIVAKLITTIFKKDRGNVYHILCAFRKNDRGVRTLIAFHPNISDAGAPIARNASALCAGGSGQDYLQGVGPMTPTIGLSGN